MLLAFQKFCNCLYFHVLTLVFWINEKIKGCNLIYMLPMVTVCNIYAREMLAFPCHQKWQYIFLLLLLEDYFFHLLLLSTIFGTLLFTLLLCKQLGAVWCKLLVAIPVTDACSGIFLCLFNTHWVCQWLILQPCWMGLSYSMLKLSVIMTCDLMLVQPSTNSSVYSTSLTWLWSTSGMIFRNFSKVPHCITYPDC